MIKKLVLAGCFVFVIFTCFLGIKNINIFHTKSVVLPAISKDIANGMIKDGECYIVQIADPETFDLSRWYFIDGKEKKPVLLVGQRPDDELSYIFKEPERNRFLVKGYVEEQLSIYHSKLVLFVEEWYFIEPIKRDYGQDDYRQEQRFFYPKSYLDAYDVEQGDYDPISTYDLIWDRSEDYYLNQDGYYKIRSRWNGRELEWFLVYDEMDPENDKKLEVRYLGDGYEEKVYIVGNSPEYLLGAAILNNGYDDEMCRDFFIVKGSLEEDEDGILHLEIYKWWINNYFIHKDEAGYKIKTGSGFDRDDIQTGAYKRYR